MEQAQSGAAAQGDADRDADLLRLAGRLARFGGWSIEVPSGELYWSAELFTMLGFEPTDGSPPLEAAIGLYPAEHRAPMQEAVDRCMADGTPIDLESVILDRAGEELRVRTIGEAVRDDAGRIVRIQGAFYDVTEIVIEREKRIAAQAGLRETLDVIPDVVCFINPSWCLTFANRATIDLTGMTRDDLYSATIWQLFPDLTSTALRPAYEDAMTARVSSSARDYIAQFDRWVEVVAHPIADGIAVFARDVTGEERARGERAALERRLDDTLNQIQDALVFLDREWRYTYLNETAERYLQNSADALLGAVIWQAYPGSYDSEFGAAYRRAMEERVVASARAFYPDLDTWFESIAYPVDEGIAVYLRDVSEEERRRQEFAQVAARAQRQAALIDASREAMIMEDLDNVVTYWNHGAEQIYGWSADEVVGRDIREILYADTTEFEAAASALLRCWRAALM